MKYTSIDAFNAAQNDDERRVCETLMATIDRGLPDAESKIWHGHPVWFLSGNPIVGYAKLKGCIRLLFWSGQSFETPGLRPEGKFKAAEIRFRAACEVDQHLLGQWLDEARHVQWDYKNIVKRRGQLERLT